MVTDLFGKWPSFDDFEVVSMFFERSHDGEEPWPVLTVRLVGFCYDGGLKNPNRKDCVLTLCFGGVENVKLDGFNHQNAINGFTVVARWSERLKQEMFDVKFIQGFGVGATFECGEIEVVNGAVLTNDTRP